MNEFTASNGIPMIEGRNFNWQKSKIYADPESTEWFYSIGFHTNDGGMWQCGYYHEEGNLYISDMAYSSNTSIKIACTLEMAEDIVMGFMEANDLELMPLYDKLYGH